MWESVWEIKSRNCVCPAMVSGNTGLIWMSETVREIGVKIHVSECIGDQHWHSPVCFISASWEWENCTGVAGCRGKEREMAGQQAILEQDRREGMVWERRGAAGAHGASV